MEDRKGWRYWTTYAFAMVCLLFLGLFACFHVHIPT